MATIIINNSEYTIPEGEKLNAIQMAQRVGVDIPYYCWHPGLSVVASCRMCLVEVGKKDDKTGKIAMQPRLVPACQTPATDGTVFVTNTEKVKQSRAIVEEDLCRFVAWQQPSLAAPVATLRRALGFDTPCTPPPATTRAAKT